MKLSQRLTIICASGLLLGVVVLEVPHTKRLTISPIVRHASLEEMAEHADVIVRGTVTKKLGTFRESGPSGEDMVYTKWAFSAEDFLKGEKQPITIVTPGGQYGTTVIEFEDMAHLPLQEPLLLALDQMNNHKGYFRIEGESQGAYAVQPDASSVRQLFTNESLLMVTVQEKISAARAVKK